jgi:1,4-dihydroxy-2-naphthoate octaprenyltransferase
VAWLAFAAAVPVGLLACALLVINNLRDIPSDTLAGKRTLAVVLGDHRARLLYTACVVLPFCAAAAMAAVAPFTLLAFAAAPFAAAPVRLVRGGAAGPRLIAALGQTGRLQLAFGALLTLGLAVRP